MGIDDQQDKTMSLISVQHFFSHVRMKFCLPSASSKPRINVQTSGESILVRNKQVRMTPVNNRLPAHPTSTSTYLKKKKGVGISFCVPPCTVFNIRKYLFRVFFMLLSYFLSTKKRYLFFFFFFFVVGQF